MKRLTNVLLLVGVVLLVGLCLVLGSPRSTGGEGEKFGGTDSAVTEELDASGYTPWFHPIFEPGSGEVESGLFAVQAALGAGLLGYCVGALTTRDRARREAAAGVAAAGSLDGSARPASRSDVGGA